jgi:Polyketide cyclase / dehydrase and lipid transport
MPSVSKSIDLPAAPDAAFALATDPSRFGEWLTIHDGWPQGEPGAPQQGASFVQKVKLVGMPADVSWTVEELDGTRLVMKGSGPMGATLSSTITVTAAGEGSTVSYESGFDGGGLQGPMADMVTKAAGDELEKSLTKLKGLA